MLPWHLSNEGSNVAASMDCIRTASYLSLRSVSMLVNGGNGILDTKRECCTLLGPLRKRSLHSYLQTCFSFAVEQFIDIWLVYMVARQRPSECSRYVGHEERGGYIRKGPLIPNTAMKFMYVMSLYTISSTVSSSTAWTSAACSSHRTSAATDSLGHRTASPGRSTPMNHWQHRTLQKWESRHSRHSVTSMLTVRIPHLNGTDGFILSKYVAEQGQSVEKIRW